MYYSIYQHRPTTYTRDVNNNQLYIY